MGRGHNTGLLFWVESLQEIQQVLSSLYKRGHCHYVTVPWHSIRVPSSGSLSWEVKQRCRKNHSHLLETTRIFLFNLCVSYNSEFISPEVETSWKIFKNNMNSAFHLEELHLRTRKLITELKTIFYTEIEFIYHKICLWKMYSSVLLVCLQSYATISAVTSGHFYHPTRNPLASLLPPSVPGDH